MDATGSHEPPQEIPEGWKAVWNPTYQEWFYVNIHTSESTWEIPTTRSVPSSKTGNPFADPSTADASLTSTNPPSSSKPPAYEPRSNHKVPDPTPEQAAFRTQDDLAFEREILADYDFDDSTATSTETSDSATAWSRKNSCRVIVKRYQKTNPFSKAAAQREIDALHNLGGLDDSIPPLLDFFDPATTIFVIAENRQDESLRKYVEGRGPLTGDLLKAVVTQLMTALCHILGNGLVHLKMCDETLFIDQTGQLTIKDFQYAVKYDPEKTDDLYGAVDHEVKGNTGIWCPPEVFEAEKEGVKYNGRKAVIWSCGIAIYYMVTGQLDKLANLNHPAFGGSGKRRATVTANANSDDPVPIPANPTGLGESSTGTENAKPRRLSLMGHRRRSSAAQVASSQGRTSLTASIPTPETLVSYPGSRFDIPQYIRDIVSHMLILDPLQRRELIEVAAKVPKKLVSKATRPLMELAWLDYKDHVGPYANLRLGEDVFAGGNGDDTSSMYSGISAFSQSFTGLLSGKRRQSKGGGAGYYG